MMNEFMVTPKSYHCMGWEPLCCFKHPISRNSYHSHRELIFMSPFSRGRKHLTKQSVVGTGSLSGGAQRREEEEGDEAGPQLERKRKGLESHSGGLGPPPFQFLRLCLWPAPLNGPWRSSKPCGVHGRAPDCSAPTFCGPMWCRAPPAPN